jgi:hypothetical protein
VESYGLLATTAVVAVVAALLVRRLLRIDWTPGRYKIIYHRGPTVDLSTRVSSGWLSINGNAISIRSKKEEFSIPRRDLRSVELFRLHGLGRMIRIVHGQNTLLVSVVRFCIADRFAVIDFFKTGSLVRDLSAVVG